MVDAYLALKAGLPDNSAGISIAAGASAATGSFAADSAFVTGGSPYTVPGRNQAIDTSAVANPAPSRSSGPSGYDSNGFTYTIPYLTPGAAYTVRLDFSENYFNGPGQRTFNVAINGDPALTNFDITPPPGGFKAVARTFNATADASGKVTIAFTNTTPGNPPPSAGPRSTGSRSPRVRPPPRGHHRDLAEGRPTVSSSVEGPGYAPAQAVDGNPATRWSSGQWMQSGTTGWIYVDLGSSQPIGEVRLNWETAYASTTRSRPATTPDWTTLVSVIGNQTAGVHDANGLAETARYVRVYCTKTSDSSDNYSLYDFNVYADLAARPGPGPAGLRLDGRGARLSAPANAVDGNAATRWSSGQWMQSGATGWIYVDLGSPQPIGEVRLNWETAYGADYQIQASNDAVTGPPSSPSPATPPPGSTTTAASPPPPDTSASTPPGPASRQ